LHAAANPIRDAELFHRGHHYLASRRNGRVRTHDLFGTEHGSTQLFSAGHPRNRRPGAHRDARADLTKIEA
jgi:hypothetical protein